MNQKVAITTRNLTKIYKGNIVANSNISLNIQEGEIFGLLGPNGAGKTTFVKQILGLLSPTKGEIFIYNIDVVKSPEKIKNIVNYLGQNPYALWHLTVEEAIYYTAILCGHRKQDARARTERLIEELNLKKYSKKLLLTLSGGMLRICNFAMALVADCQILILDEPTAGLDPINKKNVWEMILRYNKEKNITTVLVTHDVLEAEKVLQRVGFIDRSQIIAVGTPVELKRKVDDKMRIELVVKPEYSLTPQEKELMSNYGEVIEINPTHLILLSPREKAVSTLTHLNNSFSKIDEIRLTPPTLEDVYIKLTRGTIPNPASYKMWKEESQGEGKE